eukprot:TRINITY_DN8285_c0_g1_i2.p1 TRINITY_DN8285_c0_g1~~TRINITY_DN8285_c0_g1_i2.p1  ORF type:complete len:612 (-),score=156.52 TRINITY_DN8285_c0_g1_i2:183-1988(-)
MTHIHHRHRLYSFAALAVLLFASVASGLNNGDACSQDYECNIPYGMCSSSSSSSGEASSSSSEGSSSPSSSSSSSSSSGEAAGSCSLLPGFGVDGDKLYFLGRCDGDARLFSANLDGSSITQIGQLDETAGQILSFTSISEFDYFISRSTRLALQFDAVDRESLNITEIAYQRGTPAPTFEFDSRGATYGCLGFDVVAYDSILTGNAISSSYSIIYNYTELQDAAGDFYTCQDVDFSGDTLYILVGNGGVNDSYVLQGSVDGSAPLESILSIFSSSSFPRSTIDADSQAVYYASEFAINRVFTDGSVGPSELYTGQTPDPNVTHIEAAGDFVYFADGAFIRRTNKNTLSTDSLIPASFEYGGGASKRSVLDDAVCTCRPGFSGADCTQCAGQIQWQDGVPSCVDLLDNGFPSSCSADYHCGNPPYTRCSPSSGQCECVSSFTGRGCTLCSGTVSFNNGVPSCSDTSSGASSSAESGSASDSDGTPTPTTPCDVSITQTLRTQWQSDSATYYLYDVTVTNTGSSSVTSPTFFIRSADNQDGFRLEQSWNLVTYASTVPGQQIVSLMPDTQLSPGSSYTSAGYVVKASRTNVELSQCAPQSSK